MSPHGEQHVDQDLITRPARVPLDRPDDVVDTKGVIWTVPKREHVIRREQNARQQAIELVEARIKTGADMDEYKRHLLMELEELAQQRRGLVEDKQATLANETRFHAKQVEEQLKAVALFEAREKVLAQLASGADVAYLLTRGEEISQELENKLEEVNDQDADRISATEFIPHQAYMQVLKDLEKNPGSRKTLRESQRTLLDARLKATGGLGGSHDNVLGPSDIALKKTGAVGGSHEVITKMGEPSQESVEARQQMLLEKKWMILRQEQQDADAEYAQLGFVQKWFGEKGKMLKTKLARIKADQERVYKQILPARQKKLGTEFEQMARAMRKE